jgi:mutator protein MutT
MNHFHNLARGVCTNENGEVLVAFNKEGGHYFLPGGHIEIGEPARKALMREMIEETGAEVQVGALVGVIEHAFEHKGELKHEYNFVFIMALTDPSQAVKSREDHLSYRWYTIDALENINFRPQKMLKLVERVVDGADINYFESTIED